MLDSFKLMMKSCSRFVHEDILMSKILQTHVPDGRRFDYHPLLCVIEEIIQEIKAPIEGRRSIADQRSYAASHVEKTYSDSSHGVGNVGVHKELQKLAQQVSCKMLHRSSRDRSSHATTVSVLVLLGSHSWGGKAVLTLAALAKSYGDLWLLASVCQNDVLALSVAMLKGLARIFGASELLQHWLKALRSLVERMVDVAKFVIEFEDFPMQYVTLDDEAMALMKTDIQISCYWLIRCSVSCASQITSMIAMNFIQVELSLKALTWELLSLAYKINQVHLDLQKQMDYFHLRTENKIYLHLMHLLKEVHVDNQKVLSTLFSLKDDFPLWDASSNQKVGVSLLQNKEIILFISKPEVKFDLFVLIMQQLQNCHMNRTEKPYEIVWVPIISTGRWFNVDEKAFSYLSEALIWYSLYQPSKLSSSVIKFLHEAWHYQGEPQMVVLDSSGKVTNLDAIDMISIWGEKAYPFSVSRERELWEEENWTIEILLNGIHPLMSYWIGEGRTICLYGSNNLEWIRKLTNKMKVIQKSGIPVELVFVGTNNFDHKENILKSITEERLSRHLPHIYISIFWLRLQSIKMSKMRIGFQTESDIIMREVDSLLSFDTGKGGWLLISEGSSIELLTLVGKKVLECLSLFHVWGEMVNILGLLGAIRKVLDPPPVVDQCNYCSITPYIDGMNKRVVSCPNCLSPVDKYFVYQCSTS